jgi:hypothetical protein
MGHPALLRDLASSWWRKPTSQTRDVGHPGLLVDLEFLALDGEGGSLRECPMHERWGCSCMGTRIGDGWGVLRR